MGVMLWCLNNFGHVMYPNMVKYILYFLLQNYSDPNVKLFNLFLDI